MNPATTPLLLSTVEVAARLGCHRSTLYRLIGSDGFPVPLKIGARTKFYTIEINQWLRTNRGLTPEPERLRRARSRAGAEQIAA